LAERGMGDVEELMMVLEEIIQSTMMLPIKVGWLFQKIKNF